VALHPDRLFPVEAGARAIAGRLYAEIATLPIVSPHGHTDPRWYAEDEPFPDPATLFVKPDHYIFRMLYSQGVSLEQLGIARRDGGPVQSDPREVWRIFAQHWHLFRGTPTRLWLEHSLEDLFGITERLGPENADRIYDRIADSLAQAGLPPPGALRAVQHRGHRDHGFRARRPALPRSDPGLGLEGQGGAGLPARRRGRSGLRGLHRERGDLRAGAGFDAVTWSNYLEAHRKKRAFFKERGATATDHGHPSARTANLGEHNASALFATVAAGGGSPEERELFRAQMLTEMAKMSRDDGLVMQIHPGSVRNHNAALFEAFGRDMGADIPSATDYVRALKPMLDLVGNDPNLTIVLFTLDETAYSRELAPLAGHYPALRLGPPWWFFDSPEGMMRFRELATETAGFYNTVGFNDDTRAYLSIPARHDVARRVDCAYLARLVAEHRLDEDEAVEVARDLAYGLAKRAYKL
jgi:glucuronate isomerase